MMNRFKQLSTTFLASLLLCFLLNSCCTEKEFSLTDLRICDQESKDLGSPPECPSNLSLLASDVKWITATVRVHNSNADAKVNFRLIEVTNGADNELQTKSYTLGNIDSDLEGDECTIALAQSWPVTGVLPDADLEIRVDLEGDINDNISRTFKVRN